MSDHDALRSGLAALAPATTGRLPGDGFLLLGAGVGLVGWTGTAALARLSVPRAGLLALAVWGLLVAVMVGAGLFHVPDAMRFSLPMVGWGLLNATATTVTLVAVLQEWSATLVWTVWLVALGLGYGWTAIALWRGGQRARARGYGYAALVAAGLLIASGAGMPALQPVRYPLLAVLHAVPLALDARTTLGGRARSGVLLVAIVGTLGVGAVV
jgi:hypothetical protein